MINPNHSEIATSQLGMAENDWTLEMLGCLAMLNMAPMLQSYSCPLAHKHVGNHVSPNKQPTNSSQYVFIVKGYNFTIVILHSTYIYIYVHIYLET